MKKRFVLGGWWVVAPTLLIAGLMLLLTGTSNAAPGALPRVLLTNVLFQQQTPVCQSCHPKEYADWQAAPHAKATLNPAFKDQLAKAGNQAACLTCHTTGFPRMRWATLGREDFIRLPCPAARMIAEIPFMNAPFSSMLI